MVMRMRHMREQRICGSCANMRLHMHVKFWRMTIPSLAIGLVIRLLTWSVRGVAQVSKVTLVAVNHSYYGQSWGQSTSDQMSSRSQVSKLTLCVKNGTITDHSPPPKPLQELGFKGQLKILALLPYASLLNLLSGQMGIS